ncbi:murein hydrolase activator EnvC family protein [Cytobacillus gottheilii]|uniref:murein hydrolase activator EnvC family protein n=1 Tax=Cytobacillus gottheilii TaxID=859144 RepID=UPI0021482C6B|nr:peptidoglycan DD-metalloendopeptidase family protein [Cytobacillus gottheilii]
MKKKRLLVLSMATMLGAGGLAIGTPANQAFAENKINNLQKEQEKLQQERSGVDSQINSAGTEIEQLQNEQENVKAEIKRLDLAISDAQTKITEKNEQISKTKDEIAKLQEEIGILKERIEKRNELLKDRARSFQETGGAVSYIDVLMGAQSFSDFIDRVGAVATIMEADQSILKEHQADKDLLEEKQTTVEKELASLETMLADLQQLEKELNSQKGEKDKLMASLQEKEEQKHAEITDLEEQKEILAAQTAAVEKAIKLEKQRQEEAARKAAEAAAAAQQAAAKKNSSSSSSSGSTPPASGGGQQVSAPPVASGAFTRPSAGRLSSGFGPRWGTFHYGIDLAAQGSVPVVAAADGVVIRSYYSSSYGNAIFVAHSIDGVVYTTVYAHLSSRSVGSGAVVSKGQQLGYMGNTGQSYGQHLHFELHRGQWNASKSNAINPVGIVPL